MKGRARVTVRRKFFPDEGRVDGVTIQGKLCCFSVEEIDAARPGRRPQLTASVSSLASAGEASLRVSGGS